MKNLEIPISIFISTIGKFYSKMSDPSEALTKIALNEEVVIFIEAIACYQKLIMKSRGIRKRHIYIYSV